MSGDDQLVPRLEWLARPARALAAERVTLHHDGSAAAYFGLRPQDLSEASETFVQARVERALAQMSWSRAQIDAAVPPLRALWAKRDGRRNFNGDIARLDDFRLEGERLTLWTRRTSWWTLTISNFALRGTICDDIDTRALRERLAAEARAGVTPGAKLANGLAVHATAVTADDKIVLVKRGDQSTEGGLWASGASGSIQPRDASPFVAARREVAEELGVDVPLERLRLQGLVVQNPERDPVLLCCARLDVTFDQLLARRERALDGYEARQMAPLDVGQRGRAALLRGFTAGGVVVPSARTTAAWQQKALAGILLTLEAPP